MRGVWFGLCLLTAAGIVFSTLIFGGPTATVILLALILLTLAEPSQPTVTPYPPAPNLQPPGPPPAPYYCDNCNSPVPTNAKFCPQCGDNFQD